MAQQTIYCIYRQRISREGKADYDWYSFRTFNRQVCRLPRGRGRYVRYALSWHPLHDQNQLRRFLDEVQREGAFCTLSLRSHKALPFIKSWERVAGYYPGAVSLDPQSPWRVGSA